MALRVLTARYEADCHRVSPVAGGYAPRSACSFAPPVWVVCQASQPAPVCPAVGKI